MSQQHINAVTQFGAWLRRFNPELASKTRSMLSPETALLRMRPEVQSGMGNYAPLSNRGKGIAPFEKFVRGSGDNMSGLGSALEFEMTDDSYGYTTAPTESPVSSWGKDLLSLGQSLLQVKAQQDLLKANISRAERGLAPIEASSLAPQVNVGLSPDIMRLLVIGGVGAALLFAFTASRK